MNEPLGYSKEKLHRDIFVPIDYSQVIELRKHAALPLSVDDYYPTPTSTEGFIEVATELFQQLMHVYQEFGIDPSTSSSFQRYGKLESHNHGGDNFMPIRKLLRTEKQKIKKVVTVLGAGFPLIIRREVPDAGLTVFDINPNNQVAYGHIIDLVQGQGYFLDMELPEMTQAFLNQVGSPDFLYISNIIAFISKNLDHERNCQRLAEVFKQTQTKIIMGTYIGAAQWEVTHPFLEGLKAQGYELEINQSELSSSSGTYIARL